MNHESRIKKVCSVFFNKFPYHFKQTKIFLLYELSPVRMLSVNCPTRFLIIHTQKHSRYHFPILVHIDQCFLSLQNVLIIVVIPQIWVHVLEEQLHMLVNVVCLWRLDCLCRQVHLPLQLVFCPCQVRVKWVNVSVEVFGNFIHYVVCGNLCRPVNDQSLFNYFLDPNLWVVKGQTIKHLEFGHGHVLNIVNCIDHNLLEHPLF